MDDARDSEIASVEQELAQIQGEMDDLSEQKRKINNEWEQQAGERSALDQQLKEEREKLGNEKQRAVNINRAIQTSQQKIKTLESNSELQREQESVTLSTRNMRQPTLGVLLAHSVGIFQFVCVFTMCPRLSVNCNVNCRMR